MMFFRIVLFVLTLVLCVSCASPVESNGHADPDRQPDAMTSPEPTPATAATAAFEPALSWSDLTRLAREHRQHGELDKARERLSQAADQVRPLTPTNAQRRTVFGLRARLAIDLADAGEIDSADELTDELLAEAEATPELGGNALVTLALSVADRREPDSRLPLLRVAFATAQTEATSRKRMDLASEVATVAYQEKDYALARRAIDQAIADTRHLSPSKRGKIAKLELYRSRIALAQPDLDAAETSATTANRIFEEVSADPSNRGVAEATLAEILIKKGDSERALLIARGAFARIGGEEPIQKYAQRIILAAMARAERSTGDSDSARRHFERALAISQADNTTDTTDTADDTLVEQLTLELHELDEEGMSSLPPTGGE